MRSRILYIYTSRLCCIGGDNAAAVQEEGGREREGKGEEGERRDRVVG